MLKTLNTQKIFKMRNIFQLKNIEKILKFECKIIPSVLCISIHLLAGDRLLC